MHAFSMMGIKKNLQKTSCDDLVSGHNDGSLEDPNVIAQPAVNSPVRRKKNKKFSLFMIDVSKKPKGARQLRRSENTNSLIQAEQDSMSVLDESDYLSVYEPSLSAFATLFLEHEKMRVWNDFVNHTEEDQHEILCGLQSLQLHDYDDDQEGDEVEKDDWLHVVDQKEDLTSVTDKRGVHPGYTTEDCFMRIDQRLRLFLRKQRLPEGMLRSFEEDLMGFFSEWPTSVYVTQANSSFERMLIHVLSQYLDLVSRSHDAADGVRQTQVENRNDVFTPPPTALSDYLSSRQTNISHSINTPSD